MSAEILIDLSRQVLELVEDGDVESYPVSTALAGAGEEEGSFKTPRGRHVVRAKIGAGMPDNTVFKGRRPTGEIYSLRLAKEKPRSDWILTRILWLSGCEPGKNRFGNVDTMRRYIYIHGTPDDTDLSKPVL